MGLNSVLSLSKFKVTSTKAYDPSQVSINLLITNCLAWTFLLPFLSTQTNQLLAESLSCVGDDSQMPRQFVDASCLVNGSFHMENQGFPSTSHLLHEDKKYTNFKWIPIVLLLCCGLATMPTSLHHRLLGCAIKRKFGRKSEKCHKEGCDESTE